MNGPSDFDRGWAAGFYEGEGHVSFLGRVKRDGSPRARRRLSLSVGQKERAPLDRFQLIIGCGTIYPVKAGGFVLSVARAAEVRAVLSLLWPGLSDRRRRQAQLALQGYDSEMLRRVHPATHLGTYSRRYRGRAYKLVEANF